MIKADRGITLMILIITVIILLILGGIGVYTSVDLVRNSKSNKLTVELETVQHAILEEYTKYNAINKVNSNFEFLGTKLTDDNLKKNHIEKGIGKYYFEYDSGKVIELKDLNIQNYYIIDESSLNKLGIKNSEDEYIVNYKTGEVMNKTKLKNNVGEALYICNN